MVPDAQVRSYYGRPVVRPPVWKDEIGWYLFSGGLGGASLALAAAARLAGDDRTARRALFAGVAGLGVSPPLLIKDLGRPARFHHMLRVFKPTSPMSVGTWILTGAGVCSAAALGGELAPVLPGRRLRRVATAARPAGAAAEVAAGVLGLGVTTYTAVLLADTAVPVWHEARSVLPFVFAGSAAASAGAAGVLLAPPREAGTARLLCAAGVLGEVAAAVLMEHRLGDLGAPLREGLPGRLSRAARGLSATGAALAVTLGRTRRAAAVAGGAAVLAGSACERMAVFRAGTASASDPRHTVGPQRERVAAATDRTGP